MAERVKLPLGETLTLSLRWTKYVLLRHWVTLLGLFGANVGLILAVGLWVLLHVAGGAGTPAVFGLLFLVSMLVLTVGVLSCVAFAVIVHHEVLVGPAGFNRATLGPRGSRVFRYFLDWVVAGLGTAMAMMIGVLVLLIVSRSLAPKESSIAQIVVIPAMLGCSVLAVLTVSRLVLRLPSRAIGRPLPWRDVWRMGRGSSWRLVLGPFILSILPAIVAAIVEMPFELFDASRPSLFDLIAHMGPAGHAQISPEMFNPLERGPMGVGEIVASIVSVILSLALLAFQITAIPAFLSLAYARLYDNLALDPLQEGVEDPDRPPWEYDDDYR